MAPFLRLALVLGPDPGPGTLAIIIITTTTTVTTDITVTTATRGLLVVTDITTDCLSPWRFEAHRIFMMNGFTKLLPIHQPRMSLGKFITIAPEYVKLPSRSVKVCYLLTRLYVLGGVSGVSQCRDPRSGIHQVKPRNGLQAVSCDHQVPRLKCRQPYSDVLNNRATYF